MNRLWLVSSLAALAFSSCSSKFSLPKSAQVFSPTESIPVFLFWPQEDTSRTSVKFKTLVTVYGKEIEGILFLRRIEDTLYRATFLAKGTLKLFDMELHRDTFALLDHAKQFSNPAAVGAIAHDMQVLAFQLHQSLRPKKLWKKDSLLFAEKEEKKSRFYFVWKESTLTDLTETNFKDKKNLSVHLDAYHENRPSHLFLRHHRFRMQIELTLLE